MSSVRKVVDDIDLEEEVITKSSKSKSVVIQKVIHKVVDDSSVEESDDDDDDDDYKFTDCEVCCDSKIHIIECPYCVYKACIECYQKVILSSITKPSCISCKKQFNEDFFFEKFSESFIKKKYKKHRQNILFKMEETLLPETQPHVERILKTQKLQSQFDDISIQIKKLKEKQKVIKEEMFRLNNPSYFQEEKEEKNDIICPCPVNDCRGYLSNKYKCGICDTKACSKCREVKKEDHVCNEDTIKTIEELKNNCRNCPNCMTPIFKISGCDQMFCVKCKVAFSWKTGKVETGLVHNPHYFEWIKENQGFVPRNPHAIECGGLNDIYSFMYRKNVSLYMNELHVDGVSIYNRVTHIYRYLLHTQEVTLRNLPTQMDNSNNLDLRIDYLMKKLTKDEFMKKLEKRESDKTKLVEYRQIIDMFYNVSKDLINRLFEDIDEAVSSAETLISEKYQRIYDLDKIFFSEIEKIKVYSNKAIEKLKKKYGCRSVYMIEF